MDTIHLSSFLVVHSALLSTHLISSIWATARVVISLFTLTARATLMTRVVARSQRRSLGLKVGAALKLCW